MAMTPGWLHDVFAPECSRGDLFEEFYGTPTKWAAHEALLDLTGGRPYWPGRKPISRNTVSKELVLRILKYQTP